MQIKFYLKATCILACLLSATSALAQPTLSNAFLPDTIGPGSNTAFSFTVTNGSGTPVTNVSFVDVLPATVTISDPGMLFTDCNLGASGSITAPDGGSTITLSDAQVGAFQSCTITVNVTSSTPGTHTNPAITLNSSAGSSMSLPVDLTVATDRPAFSKNFSPSSIAFGTRSTLTFTIDNTLNADMVSNLRFSDVLPTGLFIADPPALATDCTNAEVTAVPGTQVIELSGASTLNAAAICNVSLDVIGSNIGTLNNQTSDLNSNNGVTLYSSGFAVASLQVTTTPIAFSKQFVNDPVIPGTNVTMTYDIGNQNRSFSATNLTFTDDLSTLIPALPGLVFDSILLNNCGGSVSGTGSTIINFTGGTVAPEGNCQISVQLSVPVSAAAGSYTSTSSAISGMVDGSPVVGNQASDDLFIEFAPIFTKEFIDDPTAPGGTTTLRFTITNTNPGSSISDLEFSDDIGGVGDQRAGTIPFMAANGLVAPGGLDPQPMTDPCGPGSVLTVPDGNDTLPSPPFPNLPSDPTMLIFSGGFLAAAGNPGDSCIFDVVLDVPLETPTGIYTNTTTNLANATDIYSAATDDLVIIAAPTLVKSFSDDPVAPGGTVTMSFRLLNSENSPSNATDISFTDDMSFLSGVVVNLPPTPDPPCGAGSTLSAPGNVLTLTGGNLMPAEACNFSVTLDIPVATTPGIYPNVTSEVSATVAGMSTNSGPAADDLNVSGLLFTKTFVDDPVVAGGIVSLRFDIENIHPSENATNITFSDALADVLPGTPDLTAILPPTTDTCGGTMTGTTFITYSGGSVNAGSACSIEIGVQVPAGAADGQYNNITTPLSATQGANVVIDPATDLLTINSAVIGLSKVFTDDPVSPGNQVTLEFTVTNIDNNNNLSNISFTDDLDATLSGLTATGLPLSNVCGAGSQLSGVSLITLTGGNLAPGGSCTFAVTLQVPAATPPNMYLNTTSSATGVLNGLAVTGDPASDSLLVTNAIAFTMSFDGPTTATGSAIITFDINNPSTINTSNMAFTHDLNSVVPGLIATGLPMNDVCGSGSQLSGTSVMAFSGGHLLPSSNCSFDVTVQVPTSTTAGTYPATTSDLTDNGLFLAGPATASLIIEPPPLFSKQFTPASIAVGQVSTLQFIVDNTASALSADNLDFTDNFPAGMQIASPANASTSCTGGTLIANVGSSSMTYTGGSVSAGGSCLVTVDVTPVVPGSLINTTADLTSTSGNSGTATNTLIVNPQPGFNKVFSPNPTAVNGIVTLTFDIDNTASTAAATALDFTDNMPAGLIVATPANASTTCIGGTLTAVSSSGVVTYTGGGVAAATSCSVTVDVTAATAGSYINTTGNLTSNLGNSGTASDTLTVSDALLFSKAFSPNAIVSGGTSTLSFTLDNSANGVAATAIDFVDNMPAALVIANPANINNSCTGGTLTAASGTSTINYTGGSVSANSSCNISIDVTSLTIGSHTNVTGDLTSSLGNSGPASDTLTVSDAPLFSKTFTPNAILSGGTSTLSFTLDNSANVVAATAIDFVDNMPAAIVIANPANINNSCTGGTLTAASGTSTINYTGGSVPANSSCNISIDVTSSTNGLHANVTGDLTSSLGNSGPASDTLTVSDAPLFSKAFTPNAILSGETSTLSFTLDNSANGLAATAIDFVDNMPAAIVIANPANINNSCTGGTLTAASGTSTINYTGGSVPANSSCNISIDVTSSTIGSHTNVTGNLTSSFGSSGTSSDTLAVELGLSMNKTFTNSTINAGETTELILEITNQSSQGATQISFVDDLSAFIPGATAQNLPLNDSCGLGSIVSGTQVITLTNGSLTGGDSCQISVLITIPENTPAGSYTNTTGPITANIGGNTVDGGIESTGNAILSINGALMMVPTLNNVWLLLLAMLLLLIGQRWLIRR